MDILQIAQLIFMVLVALGLGGVIVYLVINSKPPEDEHDETPFPHNPHENVEPYSPLNFNPSLNATGCLRESRTLKGPDGQEDIHVVVDIPKGEPNTPVRYEWDIRTDGQHGNKLIPDFHRDITCNHPKPGVTLNISSISGFIWLVQHGLNIYPGNKYGLKLTTKNKTRVLDSAKADHPKLTPKQVVDMVCKFWIGGELYDMSPQTEDEAFWAIHYLGDKDENLILNLGILIKHKVLDGEFEFLKFELMKLPADHAVMATVR